ncbi:hypothetical protein SmJEL517_g05518 [Synchytrium microbalum]|uniref:Phospholipid/glycerol acyltransferase domain-containing protein n=1 Tax=Synchytrium microbalum TaxID=1806994 RepID=A0A507BU04_9FUNG|nr:uncharacterized protein SmJEL517_g05518 [Synchytrium microbalum]TPX31062.1 hypothetical protein SmJEL517_g05518 [Synchytrium microbalum]
MEKYSRWRDPGTGIHAFVPPVPLRGDRNGFQTFTSIAKSYILGPPLAFIKLTVAMILVVVFALLELVGQMLAPITLIQRAYTRLVNFVLLRSLLLLLGFYWIKSENVTVKKGARRSSSRTQPTRQSVQAGDIIATNHTSYLDVLYLGARYAPMFVTPTQTPGQVTVETIWSAFARSIRSPPLPETGLRLSDVVKTAKSNGCSVAVFPEGTTSNGRGILRMTKVFHGLEPDKVRVHVIGLKYEYEDFAPTFTVGNFIPHVFFLACQWINTLEVRYLISEEVQDLHTTLPANMTLNPDEGVMGTQIASLLNHATRLRQTSSLGVKEKLEFIAYYTERERKTRKSL